MKYCKILIELKIWHLIPYRIKPEIQGIKLIEFGFFVF